jgi:hypothetical protein
VPGDTDGRPLAPALPRPARELEIALEHLAHAAHATVAQRRNRHTGSKVFERNAYAVAEVQ